jgi:hypothetical protein
MIETRHRSHLTEPPSVVTSEELFHTSSFLLDVLVCLPHLTASRKHAAPASEPIVPPVAKIL